MFFGTTYGSRRKHPEGPEVIAKGFLQYASEDTLEGSLDSVSAVSEYARCLRALENQDDRVASPTVKRCKK